MTERSEAIIRLSSAGAGAERRHARRWIKAAQPRATANCAAILDSRGCQGYHGNPRSRTALWPGPDVRVPARRTGAHRRSEVRP
jgi:hypothetical protein